MGRVRAGRFRADLFHRIAGFELRVPPLRDRVDDLPELVAAILAKSGVDDPPALAPDTLELLRRYRWPGNVRELENVLRGACLVAEDVIPPHRPPGPGDRVGQRLATGREPRPGPRGDPDAWRRSRPGRIREAHARTDGDVAAMVEQLGIGRATVYRKLKKLGLG